MSAELLREAASLMRERAEAASPGPWRVTAEGSEGSRIAPDCGDKRERSRFLGILNGRVQPEDGYNAAHIASWHPAVALAVAEWLDQCADACAFEPTGSPGPTSALTVARAYLGEVTRA